MNDFRIHRIEKQILILLSTIYKKRFHIADQIPFLTFSHCNLSKDGSYAKVYISIYAEKDQQIKALQVLKKNIHIFRKVIAKSIRMKHIPLLDFYLC